MKTLNLRETKAWMEKCGVDFSWSGFEIMNYLSENDWFDAYENFHVRYDFMKKIAYKKCLTK